MKVLVDSSVWVAYFRGTDELPLVDWLIEEDMDKHFRLLGKHVPLNLQ